MLKIIDFLYFCMNIIASQGKKRITLEETKHSFALVLVMFLIPLAAPLLTFAMKLKINSANLVTFLVVFLGLLGYFISFQIAKKYYGENGARKANIEKLYKKYHFNRYVITFTIIIVYAFYFFFSIKISYSLGHFLGVQYPTTSVK